MRVVAVESAWCCCCGLSIDLGLCKTTGKLGDMKFVVTPGPYRGHAMLKYSSISNGRDKRGMKEVQKLLDARPEYVWVATPKQHGANGQVHLVRRGRGETKEAAKAADEEAKDGEWQHMHIMFCSRRHYLTRDETFYGFQDIALDLHLERLFGLFVDASSIRVYGEVYGGAYPHPDVPRDTKWTGKSVQKGIWYSPDVRRVTDTFPHHAPPLPST